MKDAIIPTPRFEVRKLLTGMTFTTPPSENVRERFINQWMGERKGSRTSILHERVHSGKRRRFGLDRGGRDRSVWTRNGALVGVARNISSFARTS